MSSCYTGLDRGSAQVAAHRACLEPGHLNLAGSVSFELALSPVDAAVHGKCAITCTHRQVFVLCSAHAIVQCYCCMNAINKHLKCPLRDINTNISCAAYCLCCAATLNCPVCCSA